MGFQLLHVMIFFIIFISIFFGPAKGQITTNCSTPEQTTELTVNFPTTSFTCWGRYDGYYADVEVDCTVFHYCQTWYFPTGFNETVKWDFACPSNTIFNQKILSCTPPNFSFDCQKSPDFYWVNYNLTSTTNSVSPTPPITSTESVFEADHNQSQENVFENTESQTISFPKNTDTTRRSTLDVQTQQENKDPYYQLIQDGLEFEFIKLPV